MCPPPHSTRAAARVARGFFAGAELEEIQRQVAATCAEARANWDAAVATPGGEGASSGMLMAERQVMFEHPTTWHVEHMEPPAIRAMFRLGAQFPFFHSLLRHRAPNPPHLRGHASSDRVPRCTARLLEVASALFGGEECEAEEVQYITKAPHTTYQFPLHQDNAYGQFWEP